MAATGTPGRGPGLQGGGIEEAALSGGRREDGLLGGAGSGDPAYRVALFPGFGLFSGFWIGGVAD